MTWACPNCLIDWPEPFCDECGAALNVQDINDERDLWSRRVPPDPTVRDLVDELGPDTAAVAVGVDAVYRAMHPLTAA